MARLPIPGSDDGTWGIILNDYLNVSLAPDGSIRPAAIARKADLDTSAHVLTTQLGSGTANGTTYLRGDNTWVTLASAGALQSVNNLSDVASAGVSRTNLGLGNVDNTSDATKNTTATTLTNKTIIQPVLQGSATIALADGATITTDASLGNIFTVTIAGDRTMSNPTNPTSGQKLTYRVTQDGVGSRSLAWGDAFRFGTDVLLPTLSTSPSLTDYIGFIYNSASSTWDCVAVSRGF